MGRRSITGCGEVEWGVSTPCREQEGMVDYGRSKSASFSI